jgi:hypothetical protein
MLLINSWLLIIKHLSKGLHTSNAGRARLKWYIHTAGGRRLVTRARVTTALVIIEVKYETQLKKNITCLIFPWIYKGR